MLVWGKNAQLVYVWMEDAIHEADAGGFVWVLVWELDVHFPESALEWCCFLVSTYPAAAFIFNPAHFLRGP